VFTEHGAVPEMKEGPSEPACRSRLQTAVSCFSPKGCGGERYGQKAWDKHVMYGLERRTIVNHWRRIERNLVTSKLGTRTLPRITMAGAYWLAMGCPVYRWR